MFNRARDGLNDLVRALDDREGFTRGTKRKIREKTRRAKISARQSKPTFKKKEYFRKRIPQKPKEKLREIVRKKTKNVPTKIELDEAEVDWDVQPEQRIEQIQQPPKRSERKSLLPTMSGKQRQMLFMQPGDDLIQRTIDGNTDWGIRYQFP